MYIHGEYPIWSLLDLPIKNLWLPNIEQVNGEGLAKVINYKAILCKTRVTCMAFEKHFKQLNLKTPKTIFMSHSSPDTRANAIEVLGESTVRNMTQNFNKFIHLYGGSGRKSTMQVLQCWRRHPSWPTLTVIGERSVANIKKELWFGYVPSNIHIHEHLPIHNLREKQLSNGVHICPSSQEGYGHYINEARALGAVVLTTNHPPMNEFVDDGVSGILLKSSKVAAEGYQALSPYFISPVHVSSGSICDGIKRVMKMSLEERRRMGKLARERYESDDVLVSENIKKLVYSMAE
ncbi:hypothetical protein HDU79_004616 [Rhizoclosmatium sp. JEL0117]|nr:hypothetical protein HDU79_004616 [Rhizoclosmatium sp. JEL0117]